MTPNRRLVSWLIVACLTAALTALTAVQALRRYHELRTGWSWDLAYYNQWYWALTQADGHDLGASALPPTPTRGPRSGR